MSPAISEAASAVEEEAVAFDPASGLFGILSGGAEFAETAVLILNAGLIHRVGPFRLGTHLGRRLAQQGYPTVRLDQSGKGDSRNRRSTRMAAMELDAEAVFKLLNDRLGIKSLVVGGLCSGADDALLLASRLPFISGAFLIDGYAPKTRRYYFERYLPKLFDLEAWAKRLRGIAGGNDTDPDALARIDARDWSNDADMRVRFTSVLERNARILSVFTSDVDDYYSYAGQLAAGLELSPSLEARLTEVFLRDAKHLFQLSPHREALIETILNWIQSR